MTFTTTILREKRIPEQPGVYLMKDNEGGIIYIGKAKNLRKRITSYFSRHDPNLGWKTSRLVDRIADIDFIITDNEIEAFLLESNLIKRYRPVFNIELKDQQRYT
ncbi:MAG: GIY-YIG nuclease family protein, partial [Thermoproteota archaeon]|nr:GIY-YIG nuclease family protein [Thermoproteota archaeon]